MQSKFLDILTNNSHLCHCALYVALPTECRITSVRWKPATHTQFTWISNFAVRFYAVFCLFALWHWLDRRIESGPTHTPSGWESRVRAPFWSDTYGPPRSSVESETQVWWFPSSRLIWSNDLSMVREGYCLTDRHRAKPIIFIIDVRTQPRRPGKLVFQNTSGGCVEQVTKHLNSTKQR